MSTPHSKFWQRMMTQRPSKNIEDRRSSATGVAPQGSAGYPPDTDDNLERAVKPDIRQPVPTGVEDWDFQQDVMKARAKMARMEPYKPDRRTLNHTRLAKKRS